MRLICVTTHGGCLSPAQVTASRRCKGRPSSSPLIISNGRLRRLFPLRSPPDGRRLAAPRAVYARNCRGVTPTILRKTFVKWLWSANPVASATWRTVNWGLRRNSLARSILHRSEYW
jgi:hypothetical protein